MESVTIRIPKEVLDAIDGVLNPLMGEKRSDFMRMAALERLQSLGIEVKKP